MGVLGETRDRLLGMCRERGIDLSAPVVVTCLSSEAAAGVEAGREYAIRRGKEVMIEAALKKRGDASEKRGDASLYARSAGFPDTPFGEGSVPSFLPAGADGTGPGARGQAFTDRPSNWSGTLGDVFSMSLKHVRNRAIVVAALNALAAKLRLVEHTIHCPNHDVAACGRELAAELRRRFPDARRVLLVGLQPGILDALVELYGETGVRAIDLDAENIGHVRRGVRIGSGDGDITHDVRWCEIMLVTGSSVVNGTLDGLLKHSHDASKPLVFFGNTIAAVAAVAEFERLCPFAGR